MVKKIEENKILILLACESSISSKVGRYSAMHLNKIRLEEKKITDFVINSNEKLNVEEMRPLTFCPTMEGV